MNLIFNLKFKKINLKLLETKVVFQIIPKVLVDFYDVEIEQIRLPQVRGITMQIPLIYL